MVTSPEVFDTVFRTWLRWLQDPTQKFREAFHCQISLEHVQWFLNCYMQRADRQTDRQIRKSTYIFIFNAAKTERLVNDKIFKGVLHNIGVVTNLYIMYTPEERSRNYRRRFGTHIPQDTAPHRRRSYLYTEAQYLCCCVQIMSIPCIGHLQCTEWTRCKTE